MLAQRRAPQPRPPHEDITALDPKGICFEQMLTNPVCDHHKLQIVAVTMPMHSGWVGPERIAGESKGAEFGKQLINR